MASSHVIWKMAGLSTIACAAVLAAPVWADEQPHLEAVTTSGSGADDIIVTARRSEESMQDVPISISVFTNEQISQRNIVTAADLGTYTPGLSVNGQYGPDKASFVIRGFVQQQYTAPSVGVYFADVVAPRTGSQQTGGNGAGVGSYFDLQNVQVLKGPQGTLFGRNTTGGAILLVPQKPTYDLEGFVEGSVGNFDMRRVQAALNVPLSDTFRVRLAVDRNKRDGYLRNRSGIGPKRYGDTDYWAARLSIVADLTPDLENYTIASMSESDVVGSASRMFACDPARNTQGTVNACDQINRHNARGDDFWDVESNLLSPLHRVKQWQIINTTTWQASDTLTVKNIASYSEYEESANFSVSSDNATVRDLPGVADPSFVGLPFMFVELAPGRERGRTRQHTFTEELQLQGVAFDDRLRWQVGGYLEKSVPPSPNQIHAAVNMNCTNATALECISPFGLGGMVSSYRAELRYNNKGLYGQATFNLTPQLAVTGGIRYTMDKIRAVDTSTDYVLSTSGPIQQTCANVVYFRNPDGTRILVDNPGQCSKTFIEKSSRPTWLIDLEYKPIDDVMLYAKYTRGYRQGGIAPNNYGKETWGPEKVDSYEIGAKTKFGSGEVRGYFNIAGFYNDFSDQQLTAFMIPSADSGLPGGAAIINAGKSVIKGIDVDGSVTLFDQLQLDAGYAYLDAKVKSVVIPTLPADSPFVAVLPTARSGDRLGYSPKHRITVSGTWTLPLNESIGEVSLGATYVYTARQVVINGNPYGTLPSSNLFNLNAAWNNVLGHPVDLSFFMTNVTDEYAPMAVNGTWFSEGYETYMGNAPRMWGARLRYRFGN